MKRTGKKRLIASQMIVTVIVTMLAIFVGPSFGDSGRMDFQFKPHQKSR